VYVEGNTLFAMPFDLRRLAAAGPAVRVIDGVKSDDSRGGAQFAVSGLGTLAYLPGRNSFDPRPVAWMERSGAMTVLRTTPAQWSNPEFSPDGAVPSGRWCVPRREPAPMGVA